MVPWKFLDQSLVVRCVNSHYTLAANFSILINAFDDSFGGEEDLHRPLEHLAARTQRSDGEKQGDA